MCDPVTLAVATFAVGAGQQITQYMGEQAAYKANKVAANLNYANQSDIIGQKKVQLDQEHSEKAVDTAIATVKAQGEVSASAATLGMSSASIVGALNADMFGIGRQFSTETANDQNQRLQLSNEQRGAAISRESQIMQVSKPGLLDLGLGIASSALKGASAYSTAGGKF